MFLKISRDPQGSAENDLTYDNIPSFSDKND